MAQIQPLSFPIVGDATTMNIVVLNFTTDATTCTTYFELLTAEGKQCTNGNYTLTEEEFAGWGEDNAYIDDLIAGKLGVTIVTDGN